MLALSSNYNVKVLTNVNDVLTALIKLPETENNHAFMGSHLWLNAWYKQYWQPHWALYCVQITQGETCIGFAPFYIQNASKWHQLVTLYPFGQGEPEAAEIASEYNDIYISSGYEKEVIILLAAELKKLNIDQLTWRAALHNSNILRLVKLAYHDQVEPNSSRYLIERQLWAFEQLSKNTKSRYKRSLNQLKKIEAEFSWLSQENYQSSFTTLINLHQQRWQQQGKPGVFSSTDFVNFHQQLMTTHPEDIKISVITVKHEIIAIHYYLMDKTTLYFYQSGWDQTHYANYSLGLALHIWSITHCPRPFYDFMMGAKNNSYKNKFNCQPHDMSNIHININKRSVFINKLINKLKFLCTKFT